MKTKSPEKVTVWDLPLRLWHWAFAAAILTALATGLIDELDAIIVHQWAGISVVTLLVFRVCWGIGGSVYARWSKYWTTPKQFLDHFLMHGEAKPHTSPGIVLVLALMLAAFAQSVSGLFMTDDIFFEGPLYDYADGVVADGFYWVHHNAWMVVASAVVVHLVAHLIYGVVFRDSTPLSMITGKKRLELSPVATPWWWALFSFGVAAVVFLVLGMLAD